MSSNISINFKVTLSQKETIDLRVLENGFDDISAYLKIVALKTQTFNAVPTGALEEAGTLELGFKVTSAQKTSLDEKVQASGSKDLEAYLQYVALHGVVTAVIEVRSTGNLDTMLERIARAKALNKQ